MACHRIAVLANVNEFSARLEPSSIALCACESRFVRDFLKKVLLERTAILVRTLQNKRSLLTTFARLAISVI